LSFVVDASVALAWVFSDERHDAALHWLAALEDEAAVVPTHFTLEVANGLNRAIRRGRVSLELGGEAIALLTALPIDMDPEAPARAFTDISTLAQQTRLTTYDAAYLELALRRGLPLATLDDDLRRAAAEVGVAVLS
jgi:predicted nucleic acid-binding protein